MGKVDVCIHEHGLVCIHGLSRWSRSAFASIQLVVNTTVCIDESSTNSHSSVWDTYTSHS